MAHLPAPARPRAARYTVVGTAGHIDHGKSALVKALTGTDPDRLEEERRRGMTIDLGFAHLDLPSGLRVGVVDVPGHERLIKTMLAGAAGIDLVLFVVAADEGIMPQTREHLDILRFLPVDRGLVVLTKMDLVTDPEWLALVREDVAALVAGSFLERAPVIPVSARTGEGIPALVEALDRALRDLAAPDADAPARLPVDRSFTMAGFGTVVTGTLWTGRIHAGDALVLLPEGREVRVRQVQSHGDVVEEARAGQRVALNLVGVAKDEVERGDVLVAPGTYRSSRVLDVRLRMLGSAPPLRHQDRIRFYLGAAEVIGRIRLLDRDRLAPGEEAVAQVRLEHETVAARGDAFVIRRYSPMVTIGGGEVIGADVPLRRRGRATVELLKSDAASDLDARVLAVVEASGTAGTTVEAVVPPLGLVRDRAVELMRVLVERGQVRSVRGRVFAANAVEGVGRAVAATLAGYHCEVPWRVGMPRDELKRRAFPAGDDRLYGDVLERLAAAGEVVLAGTFARAREFAPVRTAEETAAAERLDALYRRARFTTPSREEALAQVGDRSVATRMLQVLLDEGRLVDLGSDMLFHRDAVAEAEMLIGRQIEAHGPITVATARDLMASTRKYVLAVLEHLDARHVTRRVGDTRVLLRQPGPR